MARDHTRNYTSLTDTTDAGTEGNEPDGTGAAFSPVGGEGMPEGGTAGPEDDLSSLVGVPTAAGGVAGRVPGSADPLAAIEIAPAPVPAPVGLPPVAAGFGRSASLRAPSGADGRINPALRAGVPRRGVRAGPVPARGIPPCRTGRALGRGLFSSHWRSARGAGAPVAAARSPLCAIAP